MGSGVPPRDHLPFLAGPGYTVNVCSDPTWHAFMHGLPTKDPAAEESYPHQVEDLIGFPMRAGLHTG